MKLKNYGSFDYGRNLGALYDVEAWTEHRLGANPRGRTHHTAGSEKTRAMELRVRRDVARARLVHHRGVVAGEWAAGTSSPHQVAMGLNVGGRRTDVEDRRLM